MWSQEGKQRVGRWHQSKMSSHFPDKIKPLLLLLLDDRNMELLLPFSFNRIFFDETLEVAAALKNTIKGRLEGDRRQDPERNNPFLAPLRALYITILHGYPSKKYIIFCPDVVARSPYHMEAIVWPFFHFFFLSLSPSSSQRKQLQPRTSPKSRWHTRWKSFFVFRCKFLFCSNEADEDMAFGAWLLLQFFYIIHFPLSNNKCPPLQAQQS